MVNVAVNFSMIGLLILFSQHFKNIKIPKPFGKRKENGKRAKFPIFQVFPVSFIILFPWRFSIFCIFQVLLSLAIVWGICIILTATNVLHKSDPARADSKIRILYGAPWFRVPYPCEVSCCHSDDENINNSMFLQSNGASRPSPSVL